MIISHLEELWTFRRLDDRISNQEAHQPFPPEGGEHKWHLHPVRFLQVWLFMYHQYDF